MRGILRQETGDPNSPMKIPKWLRSTVRWLLFGAAGLALLVVGFYTVERWRGDRAWREYAAQSAARGEVLDALPTPSTLAPERNFMKTPVLDRWMFGPLSDPAYDQFLKDIHGKQISGPRFGTVNSAGWAVGDRVDLGKTAEVWFKKPKSGKEEPASPSEVSAKEFLALLAPMDPLLGELRGAAAARPDSELVRPTAISQKDPLKTPSARFQLVRMVAWGLVMDGCAALAEGRTEEAFGDTLAGLKLSRGLAEMPDPTLVESMVGVVATRIVLQPLWEGCQRHAWSDSQLKQFQDELALIHPMESLSRGLRTDRASFLLTLDHASARVFEDRPWLFWVRWPRGWIQQSKVAYCTCMKEFIDIMDSAGTPGFLKRKADGLARVEAVFESADYWANLSTYLGLIAVPAVQKLQFHAARADASVALARTACALERHRLAHGSYPEALAELVPAYLPEVPRDVIDGQPLRYRRGADGSFKLWSIGMDGRDDNGTPAKTQEADTTGDWVWLQQFPAAQETVGRSR